MANTISPNMSLVIPGVGTESGPTYATDINNSLTIIDQHNHSSGSGVQITPSGLNINADLALNDNSLTTIKTLSFQAQASNASTSVLYSIGVDLYYNDGSGNVVRITQGGSVSGASGTITGLPSGTASASFAAGVFTFQSATATPANIDGGSFVFRNNSANSKGLTLSPPNAMAANYALTLPAIPAQTNVMTLDTSGNISSITYNAVANNRTRSVGTTVGVGGVAISSGCGAFSTSSSVYVVVTNLSVTITTSGRPVKIALEPDNNSSGNQSYVSFNLATFAFFRDTTQLTNFGGAPPGFPTYIDPVGAGTYTYTFQVAAISSPVNVNYCRISVYEL